MIAPLRRLQDGTILSVDDRVLHFGLSRFKLDICTGTCCFVCGAKKGSTAFNDEHILPNWILRKYKLHNETITLPNGNAHKYGSYTIPCCESCNSLLGGELEEPLSKILLGGHAKVAKHLMESGPRLLFSWMAFVFLKIHLKDTSLRHYLNFNDGAVSIAEQAEYDWPMFHHLHSLARVAYTGAEIAPEAFGTLLLYPAAMTDQKPFDLIDLSFSQTLAVRMDDYVLYAVFDDACAVMNGLTKMIAAISGPLFPIQIRELAAHIGACNMHLENPPEFRTQVTNGAPIRVKILGSHEDSPRFRERDDGIYGKILHSLLADGLPTLKIAGMAQSEVEERIMKGEVSFILDDNGEFIANPKRS